MIQPGIENPAHCRENQQKILRYQAGYREQPEGAGTWEALERVQATVLSPEEWL